MGFFLVGSGGEEGKGVESGAPEPLLLVLLQSLKTLGGECQQSGDYLMDFRG